MNFRKCKPKAKASRLANSQKIMAKIYIIMRGRIIVSTHAYFIDAIETKTMLNKELGNFYRIVEAKFNPIWKQTKTPR